MANGDKKPVFKKETVLEGYYFTEDGDTGCFDKHEDAVSHDRELGTRIRGGITLGKPNTPQKANCRAYLDGLIPEEYKNQKGNWKITIEFTED